jgi:hypothetical protein
VVFPITSRGDEGEVLFETFALNTAVVSRRTNAMFSNTLAVLRHPTLRDDLDPAVASIVDRLQLRVLPTDLGSARSVVDENNVPWVEVGGGLAYVVSMRASQLASPQREPFYLLFHFSELDRMKGRSRWFDPYRLANYRSTTFEPDEEVQRRWELYGSLAILLHETCHHHLGHTEPTFRAQLRTLPADRQLVERRKHELAADGCVAEQMNKMKLDARLPMLLLITHALIEEERPDSTHPGALDRLQQLRTIARPVPGAGDLSAFDEAFNRLLSNSPRPDVVEPILRYLPRGRWPTCYLGSDAQGKCLTSKKREL